MRRIISMFMIITILLALTVCSTYAETGPVPYVDASSWAVPELERASGYGFITGKIKDSMGTYITREELAELAVILYEKYTGTKAVPADSDTFTDTNNPEVFKAYNLDIVEGTNTFWKYFSPGAYATREQVAVILYRTIAAMNREVDMDASGTPVFSDEEDISIWALDAVKFMSSSGFIKGGDGRINPQKTCSREMAVLIITRVYEEYYSKAEENSDDNDDTAAAGVKGYLQLEQIVVNDVEINRDNYQIKERGGKEYILVSAEKFKYAFKQPDAGYYTYPEVSIIGSSISVNWNSEGGLTMHFEMQEGSQEAILNGAMIDIGIAPYMQNGKLYIPIDFLIAERGMAAETSSNGEIIYIQYKQDFIKQALVGTWSDSDIDLLGNLEGIIGGTLKASAFSTAYIFNSDGTYSYCMASTMGDINDTLILQKGRYSILGNTISCYDINETLYKDNPFRLQYEGKLKEKPQYLFVHNYKPGVEEIEIGGLWFNKLLK